MSAAGMVQDAAWRQPLWFAAFRAATYSLVTNLILYGVVFRLAMLAWDGSSATDTGPRLEQVLESSVTCAVLGALALGLLQRAVAAPEAALRLLACGAILWVVFAPIFLSPHLSLVETLDRMPYAIAIAMTTGALAPGHRVGDAMVVADPVLKG